MTTYNTGDPLGTVKPENLYDNTENLDYLMLGTEHQYPDRLGVGRKSWAGIEAASANKIAEIDNIITSLDTASFTFATVDAGLSGTTDGQYFRVPDEQPSVTLFIYYKNNSGAADEVGRSPSLALIEQIAGDSLASVIQLNNKIKNLRNYISSRWQFSVESENGPAETLMAIDDNGEMWLAGLVRGLQEYVEQLIPKTLANRYRGFQHVVVDKTGKTGLITINDDGDMHIVGMDDALQDRLSSLCSATFTRRMVGIQYAVFAEDLKTALMAIDDDGGMYIPGIDGPLQDNLGESLASLKTLNGVPAAAWRGEVVWSERPVLTAQKLTPNGFVFSYLPGGEATAGTGVMYVPSIREMPLDADEIHGGGSAGQSLNTSFDQAGSNIVNRDVAFRGRALAGANGRPEGGGMTPVTASELVNLNDMQYPSYRQGNVLPMYNALLSENPGNQVFIHAPFAAGGRPFAEISKGTVPYQNGVTFVQLGNDAATGVGKPYIFKFLTFEHGETDNDNGSSQNPGDYLSMMTPYFAGLQVDFLTITGQASAFCEVIGQVGSRVDTKAGGVDEQGNPSGETEVVQSYSVPATDQLAYVRANPGKAIMYGPKYPLNWLYSDGTLSHINADGKVLQGEYTAQAIYWHLYDDTKKGTWTGLKAKSLALNGSMLDVVFDVPYPPLVIDTTTIADCPGRGFSLQDGSATVQSVEVVGNETIRLTLDQAPSSSDHLLVGFTNTTENSNGDVYPLVCVRDSSEKKSRWITRSGAPFPLYNWACLDRLPLSGEF